MNKTVVVTGIGAVTPLGDDFKGSWEAVRLGRPGLAPCSKAPGLQASFAAGQLQGSYDPCRHLPPKEVLRMDPFVWYAVSAAMMAVEDAFGAGQRGGYPIGAVLMGTSRGGITRLEEAALSGRCPAYLMPGSQSGAAAACVSRRLGLTGRAMGISSACASGMQALGEGFTYIRNGLEAVCLCGGAEAPLTRFCVEAYGRAGALSKAPAPWASRPFDSGRDGFVLAEGACVLVLEELDHALSRGAAVYGEICGYGFGMDAFHDTRPDPSGQAAALRMAMESARLEAGDVDLVLAHATGTRLGDRSEEEAIKTAFGARPPGVPVFAAKALTGHMLAASGPFEAAIALMCAKEGVLPGNPNIKSKEGSLNLPGSTRAAAVRAAMASSFGLGGFNASLVVKRYG